MTRIVIVADKDTAKCFRLAGIKDVYSVQSVGEAEKRISELLENPDLTAILVT
ncbi:V-type ATP synthase subunit F, partial [Candidatus Bathyarchaeota archaeon]|nr:V-type ATP synthase subunit F [Candidatus Bathyarchaeota archaeon]